MLSVVPWLRSVGQVGVFIQGCLGTRREQVNEVDAQLDRKSLLLGILGLFYLEF